MAKRGMPLHHRIAHHILKFHRIRKHIEPGRSSWKENWNRFNDEQLGWLEDFVEKMVPWFVLLLFFIVVGEFSDMLNVFGWAWLDTVYVFFVRNEEAIQFFDNIIVALICIDLYFNFFKKRTVWAFLKSSIVDIIAIAPVGEIILLSGLGEFQSVLHVGSEIEQGAAKIIRGEEFAARSVRTIRAVSRLPRFIQLYRLIPHCKRHRT
jgi:hypothetical protein